MTTTTITSPSSSSSPPPPPPSTPSPSAILNSFYYRSLSIDERRKYDFHHQLPGQPSHEVVVAILSLSATVLTCSSSVLLATGYTSGGQSGTLVFLRSLLMSDILMAVYGLSKMLILLFLREIRVNFFLPDSLFFTASLASSSSLLSLNLDCFLKLARPFQYAQVSRDKVVSYITLVWNAAFVVGFLPLVGWHDEAYTFRFFSFYPWHFLLFNGLVVFVCVIICIACMLSLKKFYVLPDTDPSCFSARTLEIRKYRRLHRTIVAESAMWLASYLPFFVYISLTCRQCPRGDYVNKDSAIIYFLPIFLVKSLFSAFIQAFRTFRVHAVMNKIITDLSHHNHRHHHHNNSNNNYNHQHHQQQQEQQQHSITNTNDASVSTIAYTNPLCELSEDSIIPYQRTSTTSNDLTYLNHNPADRNPDHNYHFPYCRHYRPNYNYNNHQSHAADSVSVSVISQQILRYPDISADRPLDSLPVDADNSTTLHQPDNDNRYNHHQRIPRHRRGYPSDDVLMDDDDDDDGDERLMMTTARLKVHGSDDNIVGIVNMGFRPSMDLHHSTLLHNQQSTKL